MASTVFFKENKSYMRVAILGWRGYVGSGVLARLEETLTTEKILKLENISNSNDLIRFDSLLSSFNPDVLIDLSYKKTGPLDFGMSLTNKERTTQLLKLLGCFPAIKYIYAGSFLEYGVGKCNGYVQEKINLSNLIKSEYKNYVVFYFPYVHSLNPKNPIVSLLRRFSDVFRFCVRFRNMGAVIGAERREIISYFVDQCILNRDTQGSVFPPLEHIKLYNLHDLIRWFADSENIPLIDIQITIPELLFSEGNAKRYFSRKYSEIYNKKLIENIYGKVPYDNIRPSLF
jgi:hypothetical protein